MSRVFGIARMDRDGLMRRTLKISVIYNFAAAFLFAFPSSSLGRLAGLPPVVPDVYRMLLGFFVVLFGATNAWLAYEPDIDRPLVAFATIGKAGAFGIILTLWLSGRSPGRGVLAAIGDLVLAGIFAWWLFGEHQRAPAGSTAARRPTHSW
jgi:hypothetical protein